MHARPAWSNAPVPLKTLQEWIMLFLPANRRLPAMSRDHHRLVRQIEKPCLDRRKYPPGIPAWQVRSAYAVAKESISRNELVFAWYPKALASRRVPGRVQHVKFGARQRQYRALG